MSVSINGTNGLVFSDGTSLNTSPFTGGFGFRNRIINGAMMIDQRNAGASVTPTNAQYGLDRWAYGASQSSKFTAQQSSTAPSGFIKSNLITSSSAYSSTTSDFFWLEQKIEGLNCADLNWGTANAKTVTLSFWVRSSLTGNFGGALTNENTDRSYPFSFTIASANTWEQKSVTIAGDTSGTWNTSNGMGIRVAFNLGSGSNYQGTAGAWASAFYLAPTGATSVVGTNGATFYITGVQLEKGSTATSFDYRPYGTELALCQRYYYQTPTYGTSGGLATDCDGLLYYGAYTSGGIYQWASSIFPVVMRAAPTLTVSDYAGNIGKITLFTSGAGQSTNNYTPYTYGTGPRACYVGDYNNAKYGIFAKYKVEAEL